MTDYLITVNVTRILNNGVVKTTSETYCFSDNFLENAFGRVEVQMLKGGVQSWHITGVWFQVYKMDVDL